MKRGFLPYLAVIAAILAAAMLSGSLRETVLPASGEGRGPLVYLDPGHGGEDGGACSAGGMPESKINLEISLRLRDLLHLCGLQTAMTREGDYALYDPACTTVAQKKSSDLRSRAALLNACPEAILLSIHQNHFPEGKYRGAQVFYNDVVGSKALSESIQEALRQGVDPNNRRQVKRSERVYLMEQIQNTAALVECGFLSNREEATLLQEASYQQRITCGVCAGLMRYLYAQELL